MGVVIGPISENDWDTMRLIRGSLEWMKSKGEDRFRSCIEMETNIYKKIRNGYLTNRVA